jgi:hypothetical protein
MLSINVAEVGHEEGVLIPGVTEFVVDALHALAESIADQLLGGRPAMMLVLVLVLVFEQTVASVL